ncbi:hypothetical protein CDO44_26805 [Pigmentiphaga sp. NML080357]|uniref:type 4b pilus protein PilO2 n=1 Tax=Pigmentiphaga sp. NML080357 TaxID=2008675 RepID=UPI000B40E467|nr:type 4b pilus protein PilO2 [Pigmentiphaga sp. NML080357]OVZ54354.1 hypothetical protein CDO44_26805 [Pigmentiphaga sp. NML080357]
MNDYVLLRFDDDERVLVLGMRWHTILGSRLDQRARQKARQARASHYAHAENSEAVGVVRLNRADRGQAGRFYSGALAFAAEHRQGVVALRAALPDGRAWVVAAQAGKVLTQSDRVYDTAADAQAALDELAERHGDDLTVLAAADIDGDAMPFAAMMGESSAQCLLKPCGWSLPSVPRPLAVAVLGCAAAFFLRAAWDWYRSGGNQALPAPPVDTDAAWSHVLGEFRNRVRVDAEEDWNALLSQLADLPAEVGGWRLASAQCKRVSQAGWSCLAKYDRVHRLATNASFLAARPRGWSETWQPMDAVVARFAVARDGHPLDMSRLKTSVEHENETITSLQRILPLLSAATLGEPSPVRLEAPRDEHGLAIPPPASMPVILERPLTLEGPLRSMFLLPGTLASQVEWRSVFLTVDPAAEPSLNRSRLMAGISGVLYAHE